MRLLSFASRFISRYRIPTPPPRSHPFRLFSSVSPTSFPSVPPSVLSSLSSLTDFSVDPDVISTHSVDWQKKYDGRPYCIGVAFPKSTSSVSALLSFCSQHSIAIVPQSGNTSLVGGAVPSAHRLPQIILSTSKLTSIDSFDDSSGVVICGSGVVLESLNDWVESKGFIVPVDLGAKGSCRIGGNVSTNAGGLRLVRYGSLHGNVLGVEVVLPNGDVVDLISAMRKDNTGIDLKHLFIGSEGTLGVITKVSLLCARKPKSVQMCLVGVDSFASVIEVMAAARKQMAEIVSAIEFFDAKSLDLVLKFIPNTRDPLTSEKYPFYVLMETHGSHEEHDRDKMNTFLETTLSEGTVKDGIVCQDGEQMKSIWRIRESITESLAKSGKVFKYDISLPPKVMYSAVEMAADVVQKAGYRGAISVGYGHIGDSNLHLNVSFPPNVFNDTVPPFVRTQLEPAIYGFVRSHRGSVSAEHGIGQMKREYLQYSKTETAIGLMKEIKRLIDPKGILNPNKIFLST